MCTIEEMNNFLDYDSDDLIDDNMLDDNDTGSSTHDNDITEKFNFYSYVFTFSGRHYIFAQTMTNNSSPNGIHKHWVLLDSQSTVNLFYNPNPLSNIHEISEELVVNCNAGVVRTNLIGNLEGYGPVWFYVDGITNILSLFRVSQRMHVQYDSHTDNAITVWKGDGSVRKFRPGPRGLYYSDTREIEGTILALDGIHPDEIETVETNLAKYSRRQVNEATTARYFQNTARLSTRALLKMVDPPALKNSPITYEAIRITQNIWGVSVPYLKSRTTRRQSDTVELNPEIIISIPPYILSNHGVIVIRMDIMEVNGYVFLTTISRTINFGLETQLDNTNMEHVAAAL